MQRIVISLKMKVEVLLFLHKYVVDTRVDMIPDMHRMSEFQTWQNMKISWQLLF